MVLQWVEVWLWFSNCKLPRSYGRTWYLPCQYNGNFDCFEIVENTDVPYLVQYHVMSLWFWKLSTLSFFLLYLFH